METQGKHHFLFTNLVFSLHAATMQHLGKVKNPFTDKIERDLQGAQASIDMLDMIQAKTEGNLDEEEKRLMAQVLMELRLNYVDESRKKDPQGGSDQPSASTEQAKQ